MPHLYFAHQKAHVKPLGLDIVEDSAVDKGTFLFCGENNFDIYYVISSELAF